MLKAHYSRFYMTLRGALFDPKMLAARAGSTIAGAQILLLIELGQTVQGAVGSKTCDL